MATPKQVKFLALAILVTISCNLSAKPIKCFVPFKPWAVTIDLNDFEPWDLLGHNTILGGHTKDGITISILIEATKPGTTPTEMRKLYGYRYANDSGQKQTIEEIDLNDIAVITYKWVTPNIPDANEAEKTLAKEWTQNTWGFNGYIVKDDTTFDIHLSADMSKHTKIQMLDIIKSLRITPSREPEESSNLFKIIEANPESQQNEKLLKDFIEKYPTNPGAYCYLADCSRQSRQLQDNKTAYLKAMENHKIQPLTDPVLLFKCYYSLGMYYDITKEYAKSEQYHKLGYNLAKKSRIPTPYTASSAYNLAILYAQINQPDKSVDFLIEAIRLSPKYKDKVKDNSYFDKIKDNPRLKNILGK